VSALSISSQDTKASPNLAKSAKTAASGLRCISHMESVEIFTV
jgi:hypothetical protein